METIFNFLKDDTEYIYALHPKSEIVLHIKRTSDWNAKLFFTNQLNNRIDIPSDFIIYHNDEVVEPTKRRNFYTLSWWKNYDVVYNGETLYNIRSEKTWTIYN